MLGIQAGNLLDFAGNIISGLIGFGGSALFFNKQLRNNKKELSRQIESERDNSIRAEVYIERYKALNDLKSDLINVINFNKKFLNYIDIIQISMKDPDIKVSGDTSDIEKSVYELMNEYNDLKQSLLKIQGIISKDYILISSYDFGSYEIESYKNYTKNKFFNSFQMMADIFGNFRGSYFKYIKNKLKDYSYEYEVAPNYKITFRRMEGEIDDLNDNIIQLLNGVDQIKEEIKIE